MGNSTREEMAAVGIESYSTGQWQKGLLLFLLCARPSLLLELQSFVIAHLVGEDDGSVTASNLVPGVLEVGNDRLAKPNHRYLYVTSCST